MSSQQPQTQPQTESQSQQQGKLSALIIGATGAVGKRVLRELLTSNDWSRVCEAGRRLTPHEELERELPESADKEKLVQVKVDYEKMLEELGHPGLSTGTGAGAGARAGAEEVKKLRDGKWDVVFITLGTMRADAGSAAAFERIDRGYVAAAATAAKDSDPNHKQRLIYCSSMGASPQSYLLYSRSKGLTETYLAGLGYADTIIFRPGVLFNRDRPRIAEVLAQPLAKVGAMISPQVGIDISVLAKSMVRAGWLGPNQFSQLWPSIGANQTRLPSGMGVPYWILGNSSALQLAKANVNV